VSAPLGGVEEWTLNSWTNPPRVHVNPLQVVRILNCRHGVVASMGHH
jgi:hypothetical protein